MPDTSRVQLFFIGVQEFMSLIGGWGGSGKFLRPVCKTLPADAKIKAVTYDFERHAFVMRVSHRSFPPVECGAPIPWGGRVEVEVQGTTEADVSEAIQSWSMGKWKKALDEIVREKGVSVRDMLKNGPDAREATCKAQPAEYWDAKSNSCRPAPAADDPEGGPADVKRGFAYFGDAPPTTPTSDTPGPVGCHPVSDAPGAQPAEYAGTNGIGKWAEKDGFYCSPVPIGGLPTKVSYTSGVVNPETGEQVGEVRRVQAAEGRMPSQSGVWAKLINEGIVKGKPVHGRDAREATCKAQPAEYGVDGTPVTIVGRGNAYDELKGLGKLHDAIKPGSITFSGERVPPVVSWEDGEAPATSDAPLWDNAPGGLVEASEVEAAQRMAEEWLGEANAAGDRAPKDVTQSPGNPFYRPGALE